MINRYFIYLNLLLAFLVIVVFIFYIHHQRQQQQSIKQSLQYQQQRHKQLRQQLQPSLKSISINQLTQRLTALAEQHQLLINHITPQQNQLLIALQGKFCAQLALLFDINRLPFLLHYQQLEMNQAQQHVLMRLSLMSKK